MKKMILAIILFISFSKVATACSCRLIDVEEAYFDAHNVFTGAVIGLEDVQVDHGEPGAISTSDPIEVKFQVFKTLKGNDNEIISIRTARSDISCGYSFKMSETYLVYTYYLSEKNEIWVNYCSRTRPLNTAEGDLAEIEAIRATGLDER